jgi:hypothetical protein
VISQLPSSCLRQLELSFPKFLGQQGSSNLAFALRRLQSLAELTLQGAPVAPLLPAFSNLQHLTRLEITVETANIGQLGVLPVQLRSLTVSIQSSAGSRSSGSISQQQRTQPLQLAHLTALEELLSIESETQQRLALQQGDTLPAALLHVQLGLVPAKLLLQLRSLQELDLQENLLTAWDLGEIRTTLTQLSAVALRYTAPGAAAAAALRWGSLPIKRLSIEAPEALSPIVCFKLGALGTSLQELILHSYRPTAQQQQQGQHALESMLQQQQAGAQGLAPARQLASALKQLNLLQVLILHGELVDWSASSDSDSNSGGAEAAQAAGVEPNAAAAMAAAVDSARAREANMRALASAIASLSRLQHLSLHQLPLGAAAAQLRYAAYQLDTLKLEACDLTDLDVTFILLGQKSLWALAIHSEDSVTNAVLRMISIGLKRLRVLSLGGCWQISREGLSTLQGMQQLMRLNVGDTDVDGDDVLWLWRQMHGRVQVVWE